MLGIVMRTEKQNTGTAVQSADHSVRRRDRTKIPTQLRASMKQRTEPVFDATSTHYNLDMPSRFGALSYTQEKRVDVGRGHQANESSAVKKVAIIQRIRNNVVQRCGTGEGGLDPNEFFIEDVDDIKRIDKIEVKFNYNSKYNKEEFARQLAGQQTGMNELTVEEYLDNRQRYIDEGRALESNAAQQAARGKAFADKVDELQDYGWSLKEAEEQAQRWLDKQAALHNPDQVAGGWANKVDGVGDAGVNSSIGSQWRRRINDVDEQIKKMDEGMTEAERQSTYLNVSLTYDGG